MSDERLVEVGVPPGLRRPSTSEPDGRLAAAARRVWSDLGLPSRARVVATDGDGEVGTVRVDRRPVALSARRIEQAVLAGSRAVRRPGEPLAPQELLDERLKALDPSEAQEVVACLVEVALRADVAGLVRADSEAIARRLVGPGTTRRLGVVSEAVTIAAELGVVPRPLDGAGDPLGDGDGAGPDTVAEHLVRSWLEAAPPTPTIEASPATLRRLTTGPRRFRREHMANAVPGPRGLMNDLFLDYGVRPPPVSLRAVDLPDSLVRFRFGDCPTSPHLVPADSQTVLTLRPTELPADSGVVPYTDPAYGDTWSLVEGPPGPDWPMASELDPAAVATRALLAEMKTRLALWTPTWDELDTLGGLWLDYDRLHLDDARAALRWLLGAQGSVHLLARLTEAVIEAAADGVEGPAAIAARLRSRLGRSVLGPLAASMSFTRVAVGDTLAREAVERGSPAPLLEVFPELTRATGQLVVSSPGRWRREVECLLRPLGDTVVVAAEEELDHLPLATAPTA